MAFHAKYPLRRPGIFEVLNLLLAVSTAETGGTKGLIPGENGKIFDFVPTGTAAIGTIVANEGAVAEEEQVGVRIEEGTAGIASEAVDVPSIASCNPGQSRDASESAPCRAYLVRMLCPLRESKMAPVVSALGAEPRWTIQICGGCRTSPQPLHGKTTSSGSMGDSG